MGIAKKNAEWVQIGQGKEGKKLGLAKERLTVADGRSQRGMAMKTQTIQI